VGIEIPGGVLALRGPLQDTGEVMHQRGSAVPQPVLPEGEQPEEEDPGDMTRLTPDTPLEPLRRRGGHRKIQLGLG
jgi:hypothetical protein